MAQAKSASDGGGKEHGSRVTKGSEIFVGGLPRTVTEDMIRELFSTCGEIIEVRMIKNASGYSKGYCFVRFSTKEDALVALKEKNGCKLQGKTIGVCQSTEQDSLYLGNLCKGWSFEEFDKMIRQVFQDVVSVNLSKPLEIGKDPSGKKKQNRGFAFVQFASHGQPSSSGAAARAYRIGTKADFLLGNQHPVVEWFEDEPNIDPDELAKIKVAFVGNLPVDANEEYLRNLFERFGKVEKVALSKKSQAPVGFVHFSKRSELDKAIEEMDGKTVEGPQKGHKFIIQVSVAKPMNKDRKRARDKSESEPTKASSYAKQADSTRDTNFHDFSEYHISKVPRPNYLLEASHVVDPYEEAVVALPSAVSDRLLRLFRLGVATQYDIDIHTIKSLKELPESAAIAVLDQFMLSSSDEYDKRRQIATLIARYQVRYATSGRDMLQIPDRIREYARESNLLHLSGPTNVPAYDSVLSRPTSFASARYKSLSPSPPRLRYTSASVLDESMIGTDLRKNGETTTISGYRDSYLPTSQYKNSLGSTSRLAVVTEHDHLPQRPQVRYDPFTGQPYKFDPFTGEPIQQDSSRHLF